jgi:hypothetical protein
MREATLHALIEQYLGLESIETTEVLLDLCGASINAHALPFLRQRLCEEETQLPLFAAHGYTRMQEKCAQLVASLKQLIAALEEPCYDLPVKTPEIEC